MCYFGIYVTCILFKSYAKSDLPYFIRRLQQYDVWSIPLDVSYFTTDPSPSARLFELGERKKDKADIGLTVQFGVMLDNFILRTLFQYFSFHLDRENLKNTFTKERFSLDYFHSLRIVTM